MADLKPSVRATYDSAETGPRYWVTTTVAGKTVTWRQRTPDPFIRTTVQVRGLWTLLVGLLRRRLVVEVIVGGDRDVTDDVLELDDQTLIAGRTRAAAFRSSMHGKLEAFGKETTADVTH